MPHKQGNYHGYYGNGSISYFWWNLVFSPAVNLPIGSTKLYGSSLMRLQTKFQNKHLIIDEMSMLGQATFCMGRQVSKAGLLESKMNQLEEYLLLCLVTLANSHLLVTDLFLPLHLTTSYGNYIPSVHHSYHIEANTKTVWNQPRGEGIRLSESFYYDLEMERLTKVIGSNFWAVHLTELTITVSLKKLFIFFMTKKV